MDTPTPTNTNQPRLTFARLAALEPRLDRLLEEARSFKGDPTEAWYGYKVGNGGMRARMKNLVGAARILHPVLGTPEAHSVAYDTLWRALNTRKRATSRARSRCCQRATEHV